ESAYEVTLAAAFVPLAFGLYWSRATSQGAVASIVVGVSTWYFGDYLFDVEVWPPQLVALITGTGAMIVGSLLPQWIAHKPLLRNGVVHATVE
ncbi:MAG: sodium:solute symporter, partial [Limnobacter sp.]|nr:sodium:solute symporter [Limnobacter sp.]